MAFDLSHGLAVAARLTETEEKFIAVLHDAVEDGACTAQQLIDAGLPISVSSGVLALTRRDGETYYDYIGRLLGEPEPVRNVKKADLRTNIDRVDEAHLSLLPRWTEALDRLEQG